jgi:hypothetical protein
MYPNWDSEPASDKDPVPDTDPDPVIFVIDLQNAHQKILYRKVFLVSTFLMYI